VAERREHRPERRGALVADRSHDEALVAWLASRSAVLEQRSPTAFAKSLGEIYLREYAGPSIDEIDLAFATVFD
jgi:hypothetical protein